MQKIKHKIWKSDAGWFVGENINALVGPIHNKAQAVEFRNNLNRENNMVTIDPVVLHPVKKEVDNS